MLASECLRHKGTLAGIFALPIPCQQSGLEFPDIWY